MNIDDTSVFWQFSVQQTTQVLSTAGAVCCASIPGGTENTAEVQSVSQAIKEAVSRKMKKRSRDCKVQSASVSS